MNRAEKLHRKLKERLKRISGEEQFDFREKIKSFDDVIEIIKCIVLMIFFIICHNSFCFLI